MKSFFKRFAADEQGTTAVEYALIAAMISVALVTAIGPLKIALTDTFQKVANAIPEP